MECNSGYDQKTKKGGKKHFLEVMRRDMKVAERHAAHFRKWCLNPPRTEINAMGQVATHRICEGSRRDGAVVVHVT